MIILFLHQYVYCEEYLFKEILTSYVASNIKIENDLILHIILYKLFYFMFRTIFIKINIL